MAESVEGLERRIDELRVAVRRAVIAGERRRARVLRSELRGTERAWEQELAALVGERDFAVLVAEGGPAGPLLPIREQVHHALTLLAAPAAPKLIAEVHAAFFGPDAGEMTAARFTHLRRDEERSFRTAPHTRPYYLCSALTAEHLSPARGLLAISTWSLERRIIGPLSPRVDFLTAAINIAEHAARLADDAAVTRLLWRFAAGIPGATAAAARTVAPDRAGYGKAGYGREGPATAERVAAAACAELAVHVEADRAHRAAGAERARAELADVEQFFGSRRQRARGAA
ncbi:MAG TPA: hypothetical protein VFX61_14840 [Micromonosporaceae bacterium]|nr:hypothetical protein [Micromonosporaceae bacterium]